MKNTLITFLVALPILAFGQSNSIEDFYTKYKNNEDITALTLSGGMIKFAASFEEDGNTKILDKIALVRLLMMSDNNLVSKKEYHGFMKDIKKDAFDELIKIKEDGIDIDIFIREKGDTITDVLIMVKEENEFIMVSLEGNFQYSDLKDLDLNFDGGKYLKKIPEKRSSIPRA